VLVAIFFFFGGIEQALYHLNQTKAFFALFFKWGLEFLHWSDWTVTLYLLVVVMRDAPHTPAYCN
jgi:hypothetical protein